MITCLKEIRNFLVMQAVIATFLLCLTSGIYVLAGGLELLVSCNTLVFESRCSTLFHMMSLKFTARNSNLARFAIFAVKLNFTISSAFPMLNLLKVSNLNHPKQDPEACWSIAEDKSRPSINDRGALSRSCSPKRPVPQRRLCQLMKIQTLKIHNTESQIWLSW